MILGNIRIFIFVKKYSKEQWPSGTVGQLGYWHTG